MVCRSVGLPKHHWASIGGRAEFWDKDLYKHVIVQILGPRLTIPTTCMFRFKVLELDGHWAGQCTVCMPDELSAPRLSPGDIVRLRDGPELPIGWEETVPRPWPSLDPGHDGIGVVLDVNKVGGVDVDDINTMWYQEKLKYMYHIVTSAGQLLPGCHTTYDDDFTNGLGCGLPGFPSKQPPTGVPEIEGMFRSLRRGHSDRSSAAWLMDAALEKVDVQVALPRQAAACEKFFANLGLCLSVSTDEMVRLYNLMVRAYEYFFQQMQFWGLPQTQLLEVHAKTQIDLSMCNTATCRGWGHMMRATILHHQQSWSNFEHLLVDSFDLYDDEAGRIKCFLERDTLNKWLGPMHPALSDERKEELETFFQDGGFASLESLTLVNHPLRGIGIVDSALRSKMLLCLKIPFFVEVLVGGDLTLCDWEQLKSAGNDAFKLNELIIAEHCYSRALNVQVTDADDFVLYSNRSACLLKRGDECTDADGSAKIYEKALSDATLCTDARPTFAKGWFRKSKALHALGKHKSVAPAMAEFKSLNARKKPQPEQDDAKTRQRYLSEEFERVCEDL